MTTYNFLIVMKTGFLPSIVFEILTFMAGLS